MAENENDLNEQVNVTVRDSEVITVPIDPTLSNSGEAADAKAVGDALAEKADRSELQTAIKVNGQEADAQGLILVTGEDTEVSGSDSRTIAQAIEAAEGRTAEDIPMSDATGAQTIAQAMNAGATRKADQITMSDGDARTVKAAIDSNSENIGTLQRAVAGLGEQTGADIPYSSGSEETIKEHVDALEEGNVKTVNGEGPDEDGNIQLELVPLADNLYSEDSEEVIDTFRIRTTAGSGSISDGAAWAQRIRGNRVHAGYVAEQINMSVIAIPRTTPAAITASLDEATFEAYVETAGTYTLEYDDGAWSESPALYGVTVSNAPVDGDVITIVWDGENNAVLTVSAVPRTAPEEITATIDRDTFVSYVQASGTITLTYTTAWSHDPADYGITVHNDPVAGDQIVVVYVKEVRGEITVAEPSALVGTGWNLYDHSVGYAHVIKYHNTYGYRIDGTYTALAFAETPEGTQTAITPDENGLFQVTGEGYVIVTGGNSTDTAIYTTWSDWTGGYSGDFQAYQESEIDLSSIMTAYFPYGLCRVGDVRDEIDLVHQVAISRISRVSYSEEARATAEASGRAYEFDEDYIWQVRAAAVENSIDLDDEYQVSEHGMELFADTEIDVCAEILYGTNLKDKLKRQVVTGWMTVSQVKGL